MDTDAPALLEVEDLVTSFPIRTGVLNRVTGRIRAVDGVSFSVRAGETLGVVGESGCGKTTVGRTILRLQPADSGRVRFRGVSVLKAGPRELFKLRRQMQLIFQDPVGSLNPRLRVGDIVGEPLLVHGLAGGSQSADDDDTPPLDFQVAELLERCGLWPGAARRFPHEFSGGQRQRIAIARAIALRPALIVCDEPTSALDVSIQSQILNLLQDLQREFALAYLFISHDMAVIQHICDRIAVMQAGKIVEIGSRDDIITNPQHPYTQKLLAAVPSIDPRRPALTAPGRAGQE